MSVESLDIILTASAVYRFFALGYELVGNGIEIHNPSDSMRVEEFESERLSTSFEGLSHRLRSLQLTTIGCFKREEQCLESLGVACGRVLDDSLIRLDRLKIESIKYHSEPNGLKPALQGVWSKADVDALRLRLAELRFELEGNVEPFLREIVNTLPPEHFAALDSNAKALLHSLTNSNANGPILSTEGERREIHPVTHRHDESNRDAEDVARGTGDKHGVDQESLTNRVADLMHGASQDKASLLQEFFLEHLGFKSMKDREEEVTEAHKKTFEWIFGHDGSSATAATTSKSATSFPEWLKTDTKGDLYWINGKAGSGKSTLMQFINAHPRTVEGLQVWAGKKPLTRAGFFFWTSGSIEQRSQVGLLRYLLYQLLDQHRALIPITFPELWIHFWNAKTQDRIRAVVSWSLPQLMDGLKRFLDHAKNKTKICLFIDGLDEFDGDHLEIISLFRGIVDSSNYQVKVCLSSRPWSVFEEAFQSIPSLRLQDLTSDDMIQYVVDKLNGDVRIRRIAKKEPESGQDLVAEITNRADGVFLWITLIVRSLLKDVRTEDKISDLRNRLRTFPTDLDELFRYTLFQVQSKVDLKEASQLFQLIRAREEICDFTRNYTSTSSTLWELALAYDAGLQLALENPVYQPADEEVVSKCQNMKDRIDDQCAGLLGTHDKIAKRVGNPIRFKDDDPSRQAHRLARTRVTYLHRTVRDFLVSSNEWNFLLQQTIGTTFDPHTAHLQSHVLQLKLPLEEPEQHRRLDEWWPNIMFAMTHARYASVCSQETQTTLLNALNETLNWYWLPRKNVPNDNWARNAFGSYEERNKHKAEFHDPFLSLATKFGLESYVEAQLATGEFPYKGGQPILSYATQFLVHRQFTIYPLSSPSFVRSLIEHGAHPNLVYKNMAGKDETPWLSALGFVRQANRRGWFEYYDVDEENGAARVVKILGAMVDAGADVNVVILETRFDPEITALGVIEEVWEKYGQAEMGRLRDLMVEKGARVGLKR